MPNVDQLEIKKFSNLANCWWDPEGEMKPLHQMNPVRLKYIKDRTPLNNATVLDIGCGGGILSEAMAEAGASVTGIDMSDSVIKVASKHANESNLMISYKVISAEELAKITPHSFDVITCMEILEHVPNPTSIVEACAKLIKPNGHIFFSTINRNPKSYFLAILAAEYILRLLPKGTHDYGKLIKPSELDNWVRHFDLETKNISGLSYNPLTQAFSLSKDVSVNYFLHCAPKT